MPSPLHESHLLLFRNQPTLAAELIRDALHVDVPRFAEARIVAADLTDVQPAEYRADMVIELFDRTSVFGIVLEVQLSRDARKRFVWPAYVANLRARLQCAVCLLIVTADEATARWARKPIQLGGGQTFAPHVLGPSSVPQVLDEEQARAKPELAVLSAMAHGRDDDADRSVRIAALASDVAMNLDPDRSTLYFDLIINSLSEAARAALKAMDIRKYEYQSEFARRYVAQGEQRGRATIVAKQLARKFGLGVAESQQRVSRYSTEELEAVAYRLLTENSLEKVLGS